MRVFIEGELAADLEFTIRPPAVGKKDKDGKRQGEWKLFYADGTVEAVQRYKGGVLHGTSTFYYSNGKRKSVVKYNSGHTNGIATYYHESGKKASTGKYDKKGAQGWWKFYDSEGKKQKEVKFTDGIEIVGARKKTINWGKVVGAVAKGLQAYAETQREEGGASVDPEERETENAATRVSSSKLTSQLSTKKCPTCGLLTTFTGETKFDWGKLRKLHKCLNGHEYYFDDSTQARPSTWNACPVCELNAMWTGDTDIEWGKIHYVYKCTNGHKSVKVQ